VDKEKLYQRIKSGSKNNVRFGDFVTLIEAFGFRLTRINGSHHIFSHPQINDVLNLQTKNGDVKAYQVGQFLKQVAKYNLTMEKE